MKSKMRHSLHPAVEHISHHPKYRPDIDGLRAVAVLSVVGFHAFPEWVKGGFIGVDVFFVISGYLITIIILDSLKYGQFSFSGFYSRRIRRIFPALITVLIFNLILGWILLLPNEYKQLGKHTAGGIGFIANFILWNESGYFDNASETKPLLHLWSLGVEEQFYLLYPCLLWLAWKRQFNLFAMTIGIALISFAMNLWQLNVDSVADFYSPQTRFWELMVGSILAYRTLYPPTKLSQPSLAAKFSLRLLFEHHSVTDKKKAIFNELISVAGAALLGIGLLAITKASVFPGWWALFPTLGAALMIAGGVDSWLNRKILANKVLVWIGLISYPLYLWHWVLLSFLFINEGGGVANEWRFAAVCLAFLLAWFTYIIIEKRIRFGSYGKLKTIALALAALLILGLGIIVKKNHGFPSRDERTTRIALNNDYGEWDFRKNALCNQLYGESQLTFCVTNKQIPEIILFGDSHANQLYPGLVHAYRKTRGILSIGNGPPLDGVHVKFQNITEHPWQFGQDSYNRVFKIIADSSSIKTVILASNWEPIIHGEFIQSEHRTKTGHIQLIENGSADNKSNTEIFKQALERTIKNLILLNKEVVVVIDTPEPQVSTRDCLRNVNSKKFCTFNKAKVFERQAYFRSYIKELQQKYPSIKVFDPLPIICPEEECQIHNGRALYYRDLSHISYFMSDQIGMALRDLIEGQSKTDFGVEVRGSP